MIIQNEQYILFQTRHTHYILLYQTHLNPLVIYILWII